MNKNWHRIPLIFSSIFLYLGCAATLNEVNLNYHVPAEIGHTFQSPPISAVRMGMLSDKRGYENPRLIVHKQNLHGDTTKGGYLAEKSVSRLLEDALKDALTKAKYNMDSEIADFILSGELLSFNLDSTQGLKSRITITLSLTSVTSQKIVWSETFVGRAVVTEPPWLENCFTFALDDLIKKVVTSKSLAAKLKN